MSLSDLRAGLDAIQTELPRVELDQLLAQARHVSRDRYSPELDQLLSQLYQPFQAGGTSYHPLKYVNPEIVTLVLETYRAVVEQERAYTRALHAATAPAAGKGADTDGGGEDTSEARQDFYDLLADMAESTLSTELYDALWDYPQPSSFRRLYVAEVYPERTIERFATATQGRTRNGVRFARDRLFAESDILGTSLVDAFEYLADIVSGHPELAESKRTVLLSFVERYARFYAAPDSETNSPWRDYLTRGAALRILSHTGGRAELSLVDALMRDAPAVPSGRSLDDPTPLEVLAETAKADILGREDSEVR